MGGDYQPLFLREAVLALYPADASGNPITAAPVWSGPCANGLRLGLAWEEAQSFSSGDRYKTAHHNDELHTIEIERTWLIRKASPGELVGPQRSGRYVLEIVWQDARTRYWYRRVYYGVTGRSSDLHSDGPRRHDQPQVLRAEYFTASGGQGSPDVFTPIENTEGETPVGFFGEDPLLVDAYLLGHYRWSTAKRITAVHYACWPPQVETVLELELDGGLTGNQITIPVGTANTDFTADATVNIAVAAGQEIRWKVVSGPDAENAAWHLGLVMTVVNG